MNKHLLPNGNRLASLILALGCAALLRFDVQAGPRPPLPPFPEVVLKGLTFDEGWYLNRAEDVIASPFGVLAASWSGFALDRDVLILSPFILPGTTPTGKPQLPAGSGSLRVWFSPSWTSAGAGGSGPGHFARLLEMVSLDGVSTGVLWSLYTSRDGDTVYLAGATTHGAADILATKIQWKAGSWYLLTLSFNEKQTQLYLNAELVGQGVGLAGWSPAMTGLVIGSDLVGDNSAGGLFDELTTFGNPVRAEQMALYYKSLETTAALGPVAPQEKVARLEAAGIARAQAQFAPAIAESYPGGQAYSASVLGDCAANLVIKNLTNAVRLTVTNATAGVVFDLFRTLDFFGNSITNSWWYWTAKATNGQVFTFSNSPCNRVFYVLGCTNDSDADGLTDASELLVHKTSPLTNHSVNALYTDLQMVNVLVNSPDEDCGNEQNTQFESTCAVLGSNVIVAYVDSNHGVYQLGNEQINPNGFLTNRVPQMVGYAVLTNGGLTFEDRGLPPLSREGVPTNDDGVAGDPWLSVDRGSNWVYLVGASPRNAGNYGIPLWKSTDGGVIFDTPINVMNDVLGSDKPSVVVDDWPGAGQHDVYVTCTGKTNVSADSAYWFAISRDGKGGSWTNSSMPLRVVNSPNISSINDPLLLIGSDHVGHAFWFEREGFGANTTNRLKTADLKDRGMTIGLAHSIVQLRTTNQINGNLELRRNNIAGTNDFFNAWPFPVPALNNVKPGHLYVAYADTGTNSKDKANIYFTYSIDAGTNWTAPVQVNTVWTNDQWMPVLAVKPDGTKLFMGWYDRRTDTNNGLMEVYGRWGSIGTNGTVTLDDEFRITPVSYPHVFSGSDTNNFVAGQYDPVYPPDFVNLHWWYREWPDDPLELTVGTHKNHVGEYNGVAGDAHYVYFTWTDNRVRLHQSQTRAQSDIRVLRLPWP